MKSGDTIEFTTDFGHLDLKRGTRGIVTRQVNDYPHLWWVIADGHDCERWFYEDYLRPVPPLQLLAECAE